MNAVELVLHTSFECQKQEDPPPPGRHRDSGIFERACSEGSHPFLGKPSSPPDSVRRGLSRDGSRSAEWCCVRFHVWVE